MDKTLLFQYNMAMKMQAFQKMDGFKGERMIALSPEVFSRFLSNPLIQRMHLTDVGFFPHAGHHFRERKEGIEEYIYLYCVDGEGSIAIGEARYTLRKNEAFCIPSRTGHRYSASLDNPWSILWVHFKGSDAALFPLTECKVVQFESGYVPDRMMFLFNLLFLALSANYTEGNFVYISQVLMLILAETYHRERRDNVSPQSEHITNIIRHMHGHLDKALTLDDFAREFDLSRSYINALFQKHTRYSPMVFFTKLKMNRAAELLRTSPLHIYEIAHRVGYADPFYFSRTFKKYEGVSPNEYRKRH